MTFELNAESGMKLIMAALDDLIQQIKDPELRERIQKEADSLLKQKKFGLVFEDHLPECTPLYGMPIKRKSQVALKTGEVNDIYIVDKIIGDQAECVHEVSHETVTLPLKDLVVVAKFGDPIFPCLKQLDSVCNATDSDLWHTLIEADNYHALQLLKYLYAGKVDCIYIDPPYNTGAKDWKYNNDYVDGNDSYRHSKWLSMMQKRLSLAKDLLNPKDSVLIVTIDEKEYLHLGCLLEEMFKSARIQMISTVINGSGSSRSSMFSRTDEYIFFVFIGNAQVCRCREDMLHEREEGPNPWHALMRGGATGLRTARPNLFYPIFFKRNNGMYYGIGDAPDISVERNNIITPEGCFAVFPINTRGQEVTWGIEPDTFRRFKELGYIKFGKWRSGTATRSVSYLQSGTITALTQGQIEQHGFDDEGSLRLGSSERPVTPMTTWVKKSHNATAIGTNLLSKILVNRTFPYPKSLYAVQDSIRFVVANKPNALIVDFFAGSGTTLHAVNLLNEEDGGSRRCIVVTNNEVSADEAKVLSDQGYQPGDEEWEKFGIARYVTWPRTVCSIEGHDVNGQTLKGNYLNSDKPMADGFKANAAFFKLGFLDKNAVALGNQFKEILSTLWMKAGAIGACPVIDDTPDDMLILPKNRFAVLLDETMFNEFAEQMHAYPDIQTIYFITDSEKSFRDMSNQFANTTTYQLYRDYLDNFRINIGR